MTPEGTSSLTFPDIMGSSLASDMLLFGRKLAVAEALKCGLVSRVYKDVDKEVWPQIRVWSSLPPKVGFESIPKITSFVKHEFRKLEKMNEVCFFFHTIETHFHYYKYKISKYKNLLP